ncbi:hypothetical protein GCM10017161_08810 [Thalassotalea marina]|uniref:Uncharacterized protein n=1 Tax=Thalassotalea marina TaxID=1673741 RepID=A0A919EIE7_9GAMM|nr:hypothetical protein GCM10017161_08810 [Thalassotalea marina]
MTNSPETPSKGSKYTSAGTMTKPPPMPKSPAKKPAKHPNTAQDIKALKNITDFHFQENEWS